MKKLLLLLIIAAIGIRVLMPDLFLPPVVKECRHQIIATVTVTGSESEAIEQVLNTEEGRAQYEKCLRDKGAAHE